VKKIIVAEQKPISEIASLIYDYEKILLVGCAGCVAVCLSGGEKEVEILAAALRLMRRQQNKPLEILTFVATRACAPEYLADLDPLTKNVAAVVSLACGVGVQYLADRYPEKWVIPAQDTKFAGGSSEHGIWEERCGLCGDCILHHTGGVCPIIRCAKSMLNGPCGGAQNGKCEINAEMDCAWQLIYNRMKLLNKLDKLAEFQPAKDWSLARHGGPRKVIRKDVLVK
jgi:ferredoxin